MFKKVDIKATLIFGSLAAVVFCIPIFFFIQLAEYRGAWLLYLGSFFFMAVVSYHIFRDSKKRGDNESTVALVFNSHMVTIAGIIVACILCFIILSLAVPGYLGKGMADKVLTGEPANSLKDKTDGLSLDVFMAATIINFSVGSFVSIIFPFYIKRNQTRDRREPKPLHQKGRR
ncbi:MAG TPA: hypothetical protein VFZ42_07675 [Chitinophagaceae bacterium]